MAKTAMKIKQPLQNLWTSTCIPEKIRYLPYLLP